MIDVSTLGKLLVAGPDAAAFLERLYPNRFADLDGRAASATACSPPTRAGSSTTARSRGSATSSSTSRRPRPAPTACSAGSSGGTRSGGWTSRSSTSPARSPRSMSPARARASCSRGSPTPTSRRGRSRTSTRARRTSPACRACCCASASSASSATSCTSRARTASTSGTRCSSAAPTSAPFGLEAQRILRLEKQHIIIGQDTDSESNVLDAEHVVDRQARQGRLRRQVGARAHGGARRRASCSSASRWRTARCPTRAVRSCAAAGRRGASRACAAPAARQDGRPRVAAAGPGRGGRALRDPRRRPARARARAALRPFFDPTASGCAREPARVPLPERGARRRRVRAARGVAARAGARRRDGHPRPSLLGKLEVRGAPSAISARTWRCCRSRRHARSSSAPPSAVPSFASPCRDSSST